MTPHDIHIPTFDDLPELTDLGITTFREAFTGRIRDADLEGYIQSALTADKVRGALADPAVLFRVVMLEGRAVGYTKLVAVAHAGGITAKRPIELQKLYFLAACRGMGLGSQLLALAIEESRAAGHDGIWLDVWEDNKGAIRFYERNGFRLVADVDYQVGADLQRHLIMEKKL